MDVRVVSAAILAIGIVIVALLHGGLYQVVTVDANEYSRLWRVNKFTGSVLMCFPGGNGGCRVSEVLPR